MTEAHLSELFTVLCCVVVWDLGPLRVTGVSRAPLRHSCPVGDWQGYSVLMKSSK